MASLEELEKRVTLLEDIEAIKKLKVLYARACDDRFNLDMLNEVFTEDAVWDGGEQFGVYKGKKAILGFFAQVRTGFIFTIHYFIQPDIYVEGDKAHARWYMLTPATLQDKGAVWVAGYEDDKYVKINGRWWQNYMEVTLEFQTPYDKGWEKQRFV